MKLEINQGPEYVASSEAGERALGTLLGHLLVNDLPETLDENVHEALGDHNEFRGETVMYEVTDPNWGDTFYFVYGNGDVLQSIGAEQPVTNEVKV